MTIAPLAGFLDAYAPQRVRIFLVALLLLTATVVPGHHAHAQSLEPRSYANTPVGINFVLLGYGYLEGDVAFDASSPLKDAEIHSHSGLVAYARSLNVWGLSGKILAALPVADVSGSAKLRGQEKDREVLGHDADKLLNVGTNRWSFKPELGVSKAWGPLTLELIPAIAFFTNNDDFLDGKTLKQDPIYSLQGHLIYEVSRAFWAAFNATYYAGGRTTIDGDKGEPLENVRLGLTAALSLSRRQSIQLSGSTGVYSGTDSNFWTVGDRLAVLLGWRAVARTQAITCGALAGAERGSSYFGHRKSSSWFTPLLTRASDTCHTC